MLTRQHNLTEREKRHLRKRNHTTQRFSLNTFQPEMKKVREYLAPVKSSYVPTVRGRSGSKLNAATREIIAARRENRKAFFAELGVSV